MDNFFGLGGFGEIVLILFIALIFLGPEKMIGFARSLGKWVNNIRQATNNITAEISREVEEQQKTLKDAAGPLPDELATDRQDIIQSARETAAEGPGPLKGDSPDAAVPAPGQIAGSDAATSERRRNGKGEPALSGTAVEPSAGERCEVAIKSAIILDREKGKKPDTAPAT